MPPQSCIHRWLTRTKGCKREHFDGFTNSALVSILSLHTHDIVLYAYTCDRRTRHFKHSCHFATNGAVFAKVLGDRGRKVAVEFRIVNGPNIVRTGLCW